MTCADQFGVKQKTIGCSDWKVDVMRRRGGQYQLYSNGTYCPMHDTDDIDELRFRAVLHHKLFGNHYQIKRHGVVVWEIGEEDQR